MSEGFTPTSAADYPIIQTLELELPSGAKVRVRKPSVYTLMRTGQVPKDIVEIMTRPVRIAGGADLEPPAEVEQFAALDFIIAAAFVEPKVSMTPRKGSVCISDIPDEDRAEVLKALKLTL